MADVTIVNCQKCGQQYVAEAGKDIVCSCGGFTLRWERNVSYSWGDTAPLLNRITSLEQERDRLRKALEPFRRASKFFEQRYLDTDAICERDRVGECVRIEVGHLRAAARALEG